MGSIPVGIWISDLPGVGKLGAKQWYMVVHCHLVSVEIITSGRNPLVKQHRAKIVLKWKIGLEFMMLLAWEQI